MNEGEKLFSYTVVLREGRSILAVSQVPPGTIAASWMTRYEKFVGRPEHESGDDDFMVFAGFSDGSGYLIAHVGDMQAIKCNGLLERKFVGFGQ